MADGVLSGEGGFIVHVNGSRREVANNFVQQIGGDAPDTLTSTRRGSMW